MKNIITIFAIMLLTTTFAQQKQERKMGLDYTPEQMAILKSKKMALELDLNDNQQKQILNLNKKFADRKGKENEKIKGIKESGKTLTSDEKFKLQNERLDLQLEYQSEIKKILNEEQFKKWQNHKKGDASRKNKMHTHKKHRSS